MKMRLFVLLLYVFAGCGVVSELESDKGKYEKTYIKGSEARRWVRMNMLLMYVTHRMLAGSADEGFSIGRDSESLELQATLDLLVPELLSLDDSAYYRTDDVSLCIEQLSRAALYFDTLLGPLTCDLKPVGGGI